MPIFNKKRYKETCNLAQPKKKKKKKKNIQKKKKKKKKKQTKCHHEKSETSLLENTVYTADDQVDTILQNMPLACLLACLFYDTASRTHAEQWRDIVHRKIGVEPKKNQVQSPTYTRGWED